jgi:hypothetical protein
MISNLVRYPVSNREVVFACGECPSRHRRLNSTGAPEVTPPRYEYVRPRRVRGSGANPVRLSNEIRQRENQAVSILRGKFMWRKRFSIRKNRVCRIPVLEAGEHINSATYPRDRQASRVHGPLRRCRSERVHRPGRCHRAKRETSRRV